MKQTLLAFLCALLPLVVSAQSMYDSHNSYKGKIESSGYLYDSHNSYLGKVESSGYVYDKHNSSAGKAQNVKKEYAAVVFLFKMFKM